MQRIKVKDEVIVLAGKDQGKTGEVTKVLLKQNRVMVKGINVLKKTVKPTQENPGGGIIDMEGSIHLSNVALVSPKTKKATRIRIEVKDGKRIRVATKCGSVLP